MTKRKQKRAGRTLSQFVIDSRKQACPVCTLPPAIYRQVQGRPKKTIKVATVVEWLKEQGFIITEAQILAHGRAGHHLNRLRSR